MKVFRNHYRGHIREGVGESEFAAAAAAAAEAAGRAVESGTYMTVALYRHKNMLFLYDEAIGENAAPDELLAPMSDVLEKWPGEDEPRKWVYMYHVYYHAIPKDAEDWKRPAAPTCRRGRIAYLKPEKYFSYIYHHTAIVNEGLLKGDKYQSIALHENILFSYFEEPRGSINIRRVEEENSRAIEEWMAADPESHFIREPHGSNFFFIDPVFTWGHTDFREK